MCGSLYADEELGQLLIHYCGVSVPIHFPDVQNREAEIHWWPETHGDNLLKGMSSLSQKRPVQTGAPGLGSLGFSGKNESGIVARDVQVAGVHDAVAPVELFLSTDVPLAKKLVSISVRHRNP
jgi:hypothetical protein